VERPLVEERLRRVRCVEHREQSYRARLRSAAERQLQLGKPVQRRKVCRLGKARRSLSTPASVTPVFMT
jgi:hypothetical protein